MNKLSPTAKRTPIPLREGYVSWSPVKSAVELIQNYLDEADKGYEGTVKRTRGDKLIIRNEGTTIQEKHVPLGATSKKGDVDSRGQFGEGMKLAFLCLINSGREVTVRSGNERWFPKMAAFEGYGAEPILYLDRRSINYVDHAEVIVEPFGEEEYEELVSRVLELQDDIQRHRTSRGDLLLGEHNRGKLFVKGLYVCHLSEVTGERGDSFEYGYNLYDVELDRDRQVVKSSWDVKYEIREVLGSLVDSEKLSAQDIWAMMMTEQGEAKMLATDFSNAVTRILADHFRLKHGEDAIPVSSASEALESEHYGKIPVNVPGVVKRTLCASMAGLEAVKAQVSDKAETIYSLSDLTDEERENLEVVSQLVDMSSVQIVDFYGDPLGTYHGGDIRISREVLDDPVHLLSVVAHELAHEYGADGSKSHERATALLLSRLVIEQLDD